MYNNFHTDHIAFAEMPLAVHIQNAINRHIANSGVHITEEEKKAWIIASVEIVVTNNGGE